MFWLIALAMLAAAGLLLAWPLLTRGSGWKAVGLAVLLVLPLGGALLYREVGTPAALDAAVSNPRSQDFDALADDLKSRLSEREEDLEGWLLLGRSLKSLQRYDEALEALETAKRIAADSPLVAVELAEAKLFASGDPRISDEVRGLLESAVAQDPAQQKGLWLLGIDAAQRGADSEAVEYWQRLLGQLEPGSPIAESVQEQIDLARSRQGLAPAGPAADDSDWPGVTVEVGLGAAAAHALPDEIPQSAVLFVIVRPAGQTGGPPLGVARVDRPQFPLEVTVDDRNAMLPQQSLSAQEKLSFQARLSLSGEPGARAGDWESEPVEIASGGADTVSLLLSRPVE
jgi:cytochrome c-type biogenesis protein CcmH